MLSFDKCGGRIKHKIKSRVALNLKKSSTQIQLLIKFGIHLNHFYVSIKSKLDLPYHFGCAYSISNSSPTLLFTDLFWFLFQFIRPRSQFPTVKRNVILIHIAICSCLAIGMVSLVSFKRTRPQAYPGM